MNSVSSRTSLLVQNPGTLVGDKAVAAAAHETSVVDEAEFLRMLKDVRPGEAKIAAPETSGDASAQRP